MHRRNQSALLLISFIILSIIISMCSGKSSLKHPPHSKPYPVKSLPPGVSLVQLTITSLSLNSEKTMILCKIKKVHKTGPSAKHISSGTKLTIFVDKAKSDKWKKEGILIKNKTFTAEIREIPGKIYGKGKVSYEIISIVNTN